MTAVPSTTPRIRSRWSRRWWAPRTSDFTRLFTADADWRLEAGMTFHMYASADAGVAFSETVLVTDGGPECLTRTERRLFHCGEGWRGTASD